MNESISSSGSPRIKLKESGVPTCFTSVENFGWAMTDFGSEVSFYRNLGTPKVFLWGDLCKQELDNIWLLLQSPKEGQNKPQITMFFLESSYNGKEEE